MRFLLIPLTLLVQHTVVYYSTYYLVVASLFLFSLSWFWIILGLGLITSIISFLFTLIPALIQGLFAWIYNGNKLVIGLHSMVSLLALISLVMLFYSNPITIVSGNEEISVFSGLWDESPIKFLVLAPTVIGMFLTQCYAFILVPLFIDED